MLDTFLMVRTRLVILDVWQRTEHSWIEATQVVTNVPQSGMRLPELFKSILFRVWKILTKAVDTNFGPPSATKLSSLATPLCHIQNTGVLPLVSKIEGVLISRGREVKESRSNIFLMPLLKLMYQCSKGVLYAAILDSFNACILLASYSTLTWVQRAEAQPGWFE